MKCGFCELDITPPVGSIIPGGFGARYADAILDPLYVRAFVAKNESKLVAIAVIDACGITQDITDSIRNRAVSMIPANPQDIMVMATHTHGGGPTLNWGEEVVTDANYLRTLTEKASDAIYMAWKRAEESELYSGREELSDVSFIRVYEMKGNRLMTNPGRSNIDNIVKPTSTIDPEVLVLAVKQNDEFVGAVVNFATHPATIFTNEITGDYISILSREMKKIYGPEFVTVFINGACGNINHVDLYSEPEDDHVIYKRVGTKIAQKAQSAMENAELVSDNSLSSALKSIEVRFRKPSSEELVKAKELFDSFGDTLIDCTPMGTVPNYMDMFFALQAFNIMADKRTTRKLELQTLKIGNCFVAGTPSQLFVEYGKKMKAASEGPCFVSAFANDYVGYVPTPQCMREGVYEARLAPTSALEPDAGDKIADAVIEMLKSMK